LLTCRKQRPDTNSGPELMEGTQSCPRMQSKQCPR
jgi:hypothetical protein